MEETAKITDEEADDNQDQEGSDLQELRTDQHHAAVISPVQLPQNSGLPVPDNEDTFWILMRILDRKTPTNSESDEDFNVAWEDILAKNPKLIAPFRNSKDEVLLTWKCRNVPGRRRTLERELRKRTPTNSELEEDFNAAWEVILSENPSLIASFSHRKEELLLNWKCSNVPERRRLLEHQLELRTPLYSESEEDFNAAWEVILGENPSFRGYFTHLKGELLFKWKRRYEAELRSGLRADPSLADGYIYRSVRGEPKEESESGGSRTRSMQQVVDPSLSKHESPSTNDNCKSVTTTKAAGTKNSEVAAGASQRSSVEDGCSIDGHTKKKW